MKIGNELRWGQSRRFRFVLCGLAVLFCALFALNTYAQQDEGTITGVVTDPTGAVVPNASVTVAETATGFIETRATSGTGVFTIAPLKIGTYQLKISAPGFETQEQSGLQLHAQEILNINVLLKVGNQSVTVDVTSSVEQMQTQEASVGQTVATQTIEDTPLNGRNYVYIAQQTMGVMPGTQGSRGEQKGDFSANGQRAEQNNFILDGVDNNVNLADFLNGASFVIKPPPDALQEFSVQTSNYSAELGHAAGGVLNASVKSGTNDIHGSVWEFFRNDKLNAIDWFAEPSPPAGAPVIPITKPEYRQNQFGATFGGPIIKNKLFVFGDAEIDRVVYDLSSNFFSVPTPEMRASGFQDLTELLNGGASYNTKTQEIFKPGGTTPQTCPTSGYGSATVVTTGSDPNPVAYANTLCANQIDAVAKAILLQYPQANYGAVGATQNNYLFTGKVSDNTTQYDVRTDWDARQADQLFARYSYSQEIYNYPSPLGPILDGGSFSQDGKVGVEGRNFTASEIHIFTPTLVNELRFGYNWLHAYFHQENYGTDEAANYGLGGIPSSPVPPIGGMPGLSITGLSKAGTPSFFPSDEHENVVQLIDNITKTAGNHSIKFGVALQRIRFSTLQPTSPRGAETFSGVYSADGGTSNSGSGIADFLLDYMASGTINNVYTTEDQRWYNSLYFQDDWKLTRKLALNLGIRYEYAQPYEEMQGHQANLVPGTFTAAGTAFAPNYQTAGASTYLIPEKSSHYPVPETSLVNPVTGVGGGNFFTANNINIKYTENDSLVNVQKLNFAPRIGFAYSPTNKLVIRGGYGIFYGGLENLGYGPNIGSSLPFALSDSIPAQSCTSPTSCTYLGGTTTFGQNNGTVTLENGFSTVLSGGAVSPTALSVPGVKSYAVSDKTPYTESYNLSVQYQVTKTVAATIAYVGNVDLHLRASSSINTYDGLLPVNPTSGSAYSYNSFLPFGGGDPGTATANSNAYTSQAIGAGGIIIDSGIGNYNALQSKLEKTTSKNLSFIATYTWSHALDDARPPLNSYAGQGSYRLPQWLGIHYDYGTDLQDVRQRATFNGQYTLPFGVGQKYLNQAGVVNEALGGWRSAVTFRVQTGNPVELVDNTGPGNGTAYPSQIANPFATGGTPIATVSNSNPNPINTNAPGGCATATKKAGVGGSNYWFNPCSFTSQHLIQKTNPTTASPVYTEPLSYYYGHQDSTNVVGPGYNRIDMSLFKNFKLIHESVLQFRTDIFNLFNTPAHGQPATSIGGSGGGAESNQNQNNQAAGQIESERFHGEQPDSRVVQFSMKYSF